MTKKLLLRINQNLWEEIARWAKDELRSVNGQIEYVLRQAVEKHTRRKFEPSSETPPDTPAENVDRPSETPIR